MRNSLLFIFLVLSLFSCATQKKITNGENLSDPSYSSLTMNNILEIENQINTENTSYQKNERDASFLSADDLSRILQADVSYQQGDFQKAVVIYEDMAYKTRNPKIIYQAIICYQQLMLTPEQVVKLNNLYQLYIQVAPQSTLASIFKIKSWVLSGDDGNLAEAMKTLDQVLHNNPHAGNILLFLSAIFGDNTYKVENNVVLIDFAKLVVDKYKKYPEAHFFASICYSLANDDKDLRIELLDIKKNYPNFEITLYRSLGILLNKREYGTIIGLLDPQDLDLLFSDKQTGIILKKDLLNNAVLQNIYVIALLNQHEVLKARTFLFSCLKNSEDINNSLLNLGIIETKSGNYDEALVYLTRYQGTNININNLVNLLIALIYDYQGDYSKAIGYYEPLSDVTIFATTINVMLLNDYCLVHDEEKQKETFKKIALAQNFTESQEVSFSASFYLGVGDYQKAYNILDQNYPKYGGNSDYLYQYASLVALAQKTSQAIRLYRKYLKIKPDSLIANNDLAYVYASQTKDYQKALQLAKSASSQSPMDSNLLDTIGYIYYKKGDYQKAYVYIKTSFDQANNPDVSQHLKMVLLALKRNEEANKIPTVTRAVLLKDVKLQLIQRMLVLMELMQFGTEIR